MDFKLGDHVNLKLSLTKGAICFGTPGKKYFVGTYKICSKCGT